MGDEEMWNEGVPASTGFDGFPAEDGEAFDGTCNECQETGHRAKDCPNKKCFNCNQPGHAKADCTNERVEREFSGDCNICGQAGHMARDCPQKPPDTCRICGQDGHKAMQCTSKRTDLWKDADIMNDEQAWQLMKDADADKNLDQLRAALFAYIKHLNDNGLPVAMSDLENGFRSQNFKIHLIAKDKQIDEQYTYVSATGEIGQKYHLTLEWSAKPRRAIFGKGWPSTPEENLDRLNQAGFPIASQIPKCGNCGKMGHIRKHCREEQVENTFQAPVLRCVICKEEGHRARDCKTPPSNACHNCNKEGHKASDCTEPRSMANVECRRCHEMGHMASDCPNGDSRPPRACHNCGEEGHMKSECTNPRNMALMKCINCEEMGHGMRDCPKPKDWSKVRCRNCGNNGHGAARCTEPPAAADSFDANPTPTAGGDDWAPAPIDASDASAWLVDEPGTAPHGGW